MTDQTTPLTDQKLDEIEKFATDEHLTPGPWTLDREQCDCSDGYCRHGMYVTGVVTPVPTEIAAERCKRTGEQPRDYDFHRNDIGDFTEADWELMVAAREDVPALVAEVRRLRDQVADLQGENAKLIRWHGEDEAAFARMRGTIQRLRVELAAARTKAATEVIEWSGQQIGVHVPTVDAIADMLRRPAAVPAAAEGEQR